MAASDHYCYLPLALDLALPPLMWMRRLLSALGQVELWLYNQPKCEAQCVLGCRVGCGGESLVRLGLVTEEQEEFGMLGSEKRQIFVCLFDFK